MFLPSWDHLPRILKENEGTNCFRRSRLWSGLKASKGIRKSPGAFVGTFQKILLILYSRRLEVR